MNISGYYQFQTIKCEPVGSPMKHTYSIIFKLNRNFFVFFFFLDKFEFENKTYSILL